MAAKSDRKTTTYKRAQMSRLGAIRCSLRGLLILRSLNLFSDLNLDDVVCIVKYHNSLCRIFRLREFDTPLPTTPYALGEEDESRP